MLNRKVLGAFLLFIGTVLFSIPLYIWFNVPETTAMQALRSFGMHELISAAFLALGVHFLRE